MFLIIYINFSLKKKKKKNHETMTSPNRKRRQNKPKRRRFEVPTSKENGDSGTNFYSRRRQMKQLTSRIKIEIKYPNKMKNKDFSPIWWF